MVQDLAHTNGADLEGHAHLPDPRFNRRSARVIAIEEHTLSAFATPAKSSTFQIFDQLYFKGLQRRLVDVEHRLRVMDEHGIGAQIISLNQPTAQAFIDAAESVAFCRQANEYIWETYCKPYPKRFFAFAALPTQDGAAAARELCRCVEEYGFVGAMINGFTDTSDPSKSLYLDDPQYDPLWEASQKLRKPIFIHPRVPLLRNLDVLKDMPIFHGAPYGFGRETVEHVLRIMYSGVFDRFPQLKICLGHLGEGLSWMLPRTDSTFRLYTAEARGPKKHSFMDFFRSNIYTNTSGFPSTPQLVGLLAESNPHHVMFAVDYPYESVAEIRDWFNHIPVSDEAWKDIAYRNAIRAFDLPLNYD